ncbi:MAG: hypothetical protein Q8S33_35695 [Myxococcales bacterium]|nr:hypothetical protein [Myxococcales bacterium]
MKAALVLTLVVVSACKQEQAASPTPATSPTPAKDKHFTVSFSGQPATVGDAARLSLRLVATDGFHVNADYPVSFVPDESPAVAFAAPRVPLKDTAAKTLCAGSAEDTCALDATLSPKAVAAGTHRVSGVFAFSVCSADQCLIEKEPVSLQLVVSAPQ